MAKILIIDDEAAIADLLGNFLAEEGHAVLKAGDGVHGMKLAADEAVDLVITDLLMPRKGGLETVAELRRLRPAAKVIVISGVTDEKSPGTVGTLAAEFGADAFLAKPVRLAALREAVNACLGGK